MSSFEIITEDNFKKYSDTIDGTFYILMDDFCFPCQGWTDFVYPLLYDWAAEILKYRNSDNVSFQLYFIDGPYHITCKKRKDISFLQFYHDNKLVNSCETEYEQLILALRRCIGQFFRYGENSQITAVMKQNLSDILMRIKLNGENKII